MTKARDLSKLADGTEFTAADHSKLDGIEASATADQTSAQIKAAVEAATDSNVFTDADHSKLDGVAAGATADQTNAEIRAAVEAASDSNVFTDADHSKLNAIEASSDVTDATNVTAAGALMDSELTNLAAVKAINQSLVTTASPQFAGMGVTGTATVGTATASANVEFNLNGVASKAQRIQFKEGGTNRWLLGQGAASETSAFELFNATGVMSLSVNRSTNLATFANGITLTDGDLTVASGHGVYLGGTGAANKLEEYESGNFTPVFVGLSNTPTFYNLLGRYTRVGRVVTAQFFAQTNQLPTFTTASAEFKIGGFPFAVSGIGYTGSQGTVNAQSFHYHGSNNTQGTIGGSTTGGCYLTCSVNESEQMRFEVNGSGEVRGIVNNAGAAQGFIIEATCTYFTT
jgi:hypothetical protein